MADLAELLALNDQALAEDAAAAQAPVSVAPSTPMPAAPSIDELLAANERALAEDALPAPTTAQPLEQPESPAPQPDRVNLYDDAGKLVSAPTGDVQRLVAEYGYQTPEMLAQAQREAEYGAAGQQALTFAEGLGRGASFGATDVLAQTGAGLVGAAMDDVPRAAGRGLDAGLLDESAFGRAYSEAGQDIAARQEVNPGTALAGEIMGVVGASLATGGAGAVAQGAAYTPAGATAVLGAKVEQALAAKLGKGIAGRIGALAGAGAAEGAVQSAAQAVVDDVKAGDFEITAERALAGGYDLVKEALSGALLGGAAGGAIGGAIELGRGAVELGRAGIGKLTGRGAPAAVDAVPDASLTQTADDTLGLGQQLGVDGSLSQQSDDVLAVDQTLQADTQLTQAVEEASRLSNEVSGDAGVAMEMALEPVYAQRGALISSEIADAERSKAAQVFAQARASEGGFKAAQQKAVRDIAKDFNEALKITGRVDALAGISAKRRTADKFDKVIDEQKAFRINQQAVSEQLERLNAGSASDIASGNGYGSYTLEYVPIERIDAPSVWQEAKLESLRKGISSGAEIPPPRASFGEDGRYVVEDGIHRVAASREAGMTHVPMIVDEWVPAGAKPRPRPASNSVQAPDATIEMFNTFRNQIDGTLAELGETALAENGGLATLKRLRSKVDAYEKQVVGGFSSGKIGSAMMALDDFKRAVGYARNTKNAFVKQMIEGDTGADGLYGTVQRHLQDRDLWGTWAVDQMRNNATWSEKIRRSGDQQISRFFISKSGEVGANSFESQMVVNREALGSFLNQLGDAESEGVEEAFRRYLRAMEMDAKNRAKTWGSKELAAEADQLTRIVDSIEANMNAVALSRRDAKAWQELTKDVDMPGPVGWALKGAATLTQKVAGAAESASQRSATTTAAQRATGNASAASTRTQQTVMRQRASAESQARAQRVQETVVRMADAAAKQEAAVSRAARETVKIIAKPYGKVARLLPMSVGTIEKTIAESRALADAESPERQRLNEQLAVLADESPELASALEAKALGAATFIASKAGPAIDDSDPFQTRPRPMDRVKARQLARYADAIKSPTGALDRLARGVGTPEDKEVMLALYPRIYQRYVDGVIAELAKVKEPPDRKTRQRLRFATGTPMAREQRPEAVAFFQQSAARAAEPPNPEAEMAPAVSPGKARFSTDRDDRMGARSDALLSKNDD